jgi:hypothetical protein
LHAWSPRSGRCSYFHAWLRKSLFVGERAGIRQTSTEESTNRFAAPITKRCGLAYRILVAQKYYEEYAYEFHRPPLYVKAAKHSDRFTAPPP